MSSSKKLFIGLIGVIALVAFLLVQQIRRASSITTHTKVLPIISAEAVDIPLDKSEPILGSPGAPLTLVEFVDLGIADARSLHTTLAAFVAEHPQDVRLFFKDTPNSSIFSVNATLAHQAAYCAGKQKNFWPFVGRVAENSGNLREANLRKIAADLKLNSTEWWACVQSGEAGQKMEATAALSKNLSIGTAPALFVNNKRVNLGENINLKQMLGSFIAK